MKLFRIRMLIAVLLSLTGITFAQTDVTTIELNKNMADGRWEAYNCGVNFLKENDQSILKLNAQPELGLVWFKDVEFTNGSIELDIRGENKPGECFIGVAFNVIDKDTYDAIYFRPFNFLSDDSVKRGHSVQYVSHPEYTWRKLRKDYPGKYESRVNPVPDPDEFFHVKIVVNNSAISAFVNDAAEPSLVVDRLSKKISGPVGLFVGYHTEGWFKNLKVIRYE